MKRSLSWGLAVAALAAALVVPAASAQSSAVKVSLLPLPKAALGSPAQSLALANDSGVVSNAAAAYNTTSATPGQIAKLGRLTGYALDYGQTYGSGAGVVDVKTEADTYKTAAAAKKSLAFWKKDLNKKVAVLSQYGFPVTGGTFAAPKLGAGGFGQVSTASVASLTPISLATVEIAEGDYVLSVQVSADSPAAAKSLAAKLAKSLDGRVRLAVEGKLHAKPVMLPPAQTAGAPAGGPDLSQIALTASDFTGTATLVGSNYFVDPLAISAYGEDFQPAGQFAIFSQAIEWYPTAGDATFLGDLDRALFGAGIGGANVTQVDLGSVGDNAVGTLLQVPGGWVGLVVLSRGQASDLALVFSQAQLQASDLQSLGQKMAARLDAVVTG